jgi:uncharacterized protein (TIGR02265 family)
MDDFVAPDWAAPLDLAKRLAAVPSDVQVKGLFFRTALREAKAHGNAVLGRQKYAALTNYPAAELMRVLTECAKLAYPDVPPREGLRRLGHEVFPAIKENPAGRLLFSVAGNNFAAAVKLVGRAYKLLSSARATYRDVNAHSAIIEIRDAWTFPDCYHVGIMEGAARNYRSTDTVVTIRHLSMCDIDMKIEWS